MSTVFSELNKYMKNMSLNRKCNVFKNSIHTPLGAQFQRDSIEEFTHTHTQSESFAFNINNIRRIGISAFINRFPENIVCQPHRYACENVLFSSSLCESKYLRHIQKDYFAASDAHSLQ